jgi:hypothetical protein
MIDYLPTAFPRLGGATSCRAAYPSHLYLYLWTIVDN